MLAHSENLYHHLLIFLQKTTQLFFQNFMEIYVAQCEFIVLTNKTHAGDDRDYFQLVCVFQPEGFYSAPLGMADRFCTLILECGSENLKIKALTK